MNDEEKEHAARSKATAASSELSRTSSLRGLPSWAFPIRLQQLPSGNDGFIGKNVSQNSVNVD